MSFSQIIPGSPGGGQLGINNSDTDSSLEGISKSFHSSCKSGWSGLFPSSTFHVSNLTFHFLQNLSPRICFNPFYGQVVFEYFVLRQVTRQNAEKHALGVRS